MTEGKYWILVVAVIFVVRLASREAAYQRARFEKGRFVFPPVATLRLTLYLGIPLFSYAAAASAFAARQALDWWAPILFVGLIVLLLVSWPGTIELDQSGLSCQPLFRGKGRRILWRELSSAGFSRTTRKTWVCSTNGTIIEHGMFHVDPTTFREQLSVHSPVPLAEE